MRKGRSTSGDCRERIVKRRISDEQRNKHVSRSTTGGSVLIDVMFGTVVIGVVVTSLFLAFSLANRIALRARHVAVAKDTATTAIEEIRRTDFDAIAVGTSTSMVAELPDGAMEVVTAYFDPPDNKVVSVTVTVTWREREGTESFTLETLATPGGVGR
jgi:hypothetical protein